MLINEVATYRHQHPADRFDELGIGVAWDYFYNWFYEGKFHLPSRSLDRYEAAFYLIRSVLPRRIIQGYGRLPTMYRGFRLSPEQIARIEKGGLPIRSRTMAWTPWYNDAEGYIRSGREDGVVIKHNPKASEVVLSMTPDTLEFLQISPRILANPGETILSLPILKITPDMVDEVVREID